MLPDVELSVITVLYSIASATVDELVQCQS